MDGTWAPASSIVADVRRALTDIPDVASVMHSYVPRRPDLEEVACGLAFGAEGGGGLAPLGPVAPGTFACGL